MDNERHQIRVRNRGRGKKIIAHEKFSDYDAAQDRLDEIEAEYEGRSDVEVEYRDTKLYGGFK